MERGRIWNQRWVGPLRGFWNKCFLTFVTYVCCLAFQGALSAQVFERYGSPQKFSYAVEPQVVTPGEKVQVVYNRPRVPKDDIYLHYGFNGWSLGLKGPVRTSRTSDFSGAKSSFQKTYKETSQDTYLENNYFLREKMIWNPLKEAYEAQIKVPLKALSFHFVFCWNQCETWDNNEEKTYGWPIQFPFIGPILTWNHQTSLQKGVVVSFENPFPSVAWLKLGKDPEAMEQIFYSEENTLHRFILNHLQPKTRYYYQVGMGEDFQSEIFSFETAPPQGDRGLEDFNFIVLGDVQDDGKHGRFSEVVKEIKDNHKDARFLISVGDMVWNDRPSYWWIFFNKAKNLFAQKVFMPTIGNHDTPYVGSDYNVDSFLKYFHLPHLSVERTFYEFDYGPVKFFALNSERPKEFFRGKGIQFEWLNEKLRERQIQKLYLAQEGWTFAYWHIPPFNAGARHYEAQWSFRSITSLFDGVVDWHFGGHEHLYQRMKPLTSGGITSSREHYGTKIGEGVGYLIAPTAGNAPSDMLRSLKGDHNKVRELLAFPRPLPDQDKIPSYIGFVKVKVKKDFLEIQVYGNKKAPALGAGEFEVIDSVIYWKRNED